LRKDIDLINILAGKIKNIDATNKNKIDFSIALNRIQNLIESHDDLKKEFQLNPKYHFLIKHIDTLKHLSILRNDIIHTGKSMLNRYIYECFFVNQLLPLIRKFIDIQAPTPFLERKLFCKKNVIDEIIQIPLPEKYEDADNYINIKKLLNKINHFKELGRASYNNPLYMYEGVTAQQKDSEYKNLNQKEQEEANLFAQIKINKLGHFEIYVCPCCGTKALTSYEYWRTISNNRTRTETAECSVCTYKVNLRIGEPKEFGIVDFELFKYIN